MKRAFQLVLSLAVSAFFIWLSLRNTDLATVRQSLATAEYWYLLPYLLILLAIHVVRVLRWGILVEPLGKVGFKRLNSAGAIGFMALVVLPLRLGELARPLLIAEPGKIRRSSAMASVVVERVADGLFMAVVLIGSLLLLPAGESHALRALKMGGVFLFLGFFAALLFLLAAYWKRDLAVRILHRSIEPLSPKAAAKISGMIDSFIQALRVLPSRAKVAEFFVLTAVYWAVNGLGMALLARGFNLRPTLLETFATLGVLVVGIMIPAGPGMLGTFQGAIVFALETFYPGPAHAASISAYAWVLWAAQFFQQVATGLAFMAAGHVSFGSLVGAPEVEEPPPAA